MAEGTPLQEMMTKPFTLFSHEAKRWHRIMTQVSLPSAIRRRRRPSERRVRLTFSNKRRSIQEKLIYLYGKDSGAAAFGKVERKMAAFARKKPRKLRYRDAHFSPQDRFTQKDAILIAYPDSLVKEGERPLATLKRFADSQLAGAASAIHILPFYPSSSDRGFSVINYKKVDRAFGDWEDIIGLSERFDLMLDGVFNHISAKSRWFRQFLRGNPLYDNHFIAYTARDAIAAEDLKRIVRPRTSPLLSEFAAKEGTRYVWTTFSRDQPDLNFKEPRVLLRILDVLFRYVRYGAAVIRLDAVNYLWKETGTGCSNLKQTHVIVQLLRDILDLVAPSVSLLTETNVPHAYNIRYLGNGRNEAQMVYNFSLPPLVLYTMYKGDARHISRWADRLERVSPYCTYFNFLASHDGIGLTPAQRILPQREVRFLVREAKRRGSLVQDKALGSGKVTPYELNITWWSALDDGTADEARTVDRYIASRAIALSLKGVPGIYIHSLFGTANDTAAVARTKVGRDINRARLAYDTIQRELGKASRTAAVFSRFSDLLRARASCKAFHPSAPQRMLSDDPGVFSLLRTSLDGSEKVLVLVNVTGDDRQCTIDCGRLGVACHSLYDLVGKRRILAKTEGITVRSFDIALAPYQVMWLRNHAE
ncbi:sugar phosphorylase [Candidatus Woesearchaeota archaeon]|nr:sugar phosphorylase [Candidatus Woesearchaeota archaeon]